jgi:phosphate transport system substrate-binding protein
MPTASCRSLAQSGIGTVVALLASLAAQVTHSEEIAAAGGHFLSGLYHKWGEGYGSATGVQLKYAPVGSAAGVEQLRTRAVTFAMSAIPLKPSELKSKGLVQFPVAIGGVVLVVNIPNLQPGDLLLDGTTLGKIYAGEVSRWDDPRIRALNPKLSLPPQPIVPIYPTSNSGIDFLFSSYLASVSDAFRTRSRSRSPMRRELRDRARVDVFTAVDKTPGTLAYVEFAQAKHRGLSFVRLINRDGRAVTPGASSFSAAAANADWRTSGNYYTVLTNQRGLGSWPITGASFALMHGDVEDGLAAGEALRFFDWAYRRGSALTSEQDYVPLSLELITKVQQNWRTSILKKRRPLWLVK